MYINASWQTKVEVISYQKMQNFCIVGPRNDRVSDVAHYKGNDVRPAKKVIEEHHL